MSKITLSNATVEIADRITWGQKEAIQAAMLSGVKMGMQSRELDFNADALSRAKYKALEVCIVKIIVDGKEHPFSKEWMDALSVEDGDTLYAAVDAITNPEKKA